MNFRKYAGIILNILVPLLTIKQQDQKSMNKQKEK